MSIPISAGPVGCDSGTGVRLVSLLITLSADYPDLDQHTVARAVEQAAVAAEVLGSGHHPAPVEVLARDRLDAAKHRVVGRRPDTQLNIEHPARVGTTPTLLAQADPEPGRSRS